MATDLVLEVIPLAHYLVQLDPDLFFLIRLRGAELIRRSLEHLYLVLQYIQVPLYALVFPLQSLNRRQVLAIVVRGEYSVFLINPVQSLVHVPVNDGVSISTLPRLLPQADSSGGSALTC